MRDRTLLLMLDEPTAALDAEHVLFERYPAAYRMGILRFWFQAAAHRL